MIFDVHKMMLDDADYLDSIRGLIRDEKMNAEFAVNLTGENFAGIFASMDDEYMKARSADVLDISKRLIRILAGVGEEGIASEEPVVLLADDLSPSETVQMDKNKILAIVTKYGYSGQVHEYSGAGTDGCGPTGRIQRSKGSGGRLQRNLHHQSGRGCAGKIRTEEDGI